MKKERISSLLFSRAMLFLSIIVPITLAATGCSEKNNLVKSYSRSQYLPDSYSSNFVLGGPGSGPSRPFVRETWPESPNAVRAVKDDSQRVYEHSYYSYNTSSNGRPNDYFSYRIVTTSVK